MQSWKRPVDCTTSEARTVSEASKPNENLIPEKVYWLAAHPVSRLVNNPKNVGPRCIEPTDPAVRE